MAAKAAKADRGSRQLELVALAGPVEEAPAEAPAAEPRRPRRRATAEEMATRQREISISEFFTKNRRLLGFDNPSKALLTTIKEAVDNSLDACEEAESSPNLHRGPRPGVGGFGELTKGEGASWCRWRTTARHFKYQSRPIRRTGRQTRATPQPSSPPACEFRRNGCCPR